MSPNIFKAAGLAICAMSISGIASAQDRIHTDDGKVIDAKVKEVNQRTIVYRRWDNQDGADYILNRREVERIVYENGTEESFEQQQRSRGPFPPHPGRPMRNRDTDRDAPRERSRRVSGVNYGRNILSISGIQMTNESTAGVGIQYERILDKDGIIALYIPAAFSFFRDEATAYRNWQQPYTRFEANRVFMNLYPGLKFYPGGSNRRVAYSVGPSFALGFGTRYIQRDVYNNNTNQYWSTVTEQNVFRAGFMVNNGLNIQPTPHLYIGTELGLGVSYYDNTYGDYTIGEEPLVQFNFKIGYRF